MRTSSTLRYPHLRLDLDALERNVDVMRAWSQRRGLVLAPHVKTTMCRPIIDRQVAAGAHRLTVATVAQAETLWGWGHQAVLVANEVVSDADIQVLKAQHTQSPATNLACFVDSRWGVERLAKAFRDWQRPFSVLLDVGMLGGRSGVRTRTEAAEIAELVVRAPGLALTGVAGYEGVVGNDRERSLERVDAYCAYLVEVFSSLRDVYEVERPILSLGGSMYPDRGWVAMRSAERSNHVLELRSGCYVIHDHGAYAASPIEGLTPAAAVKALVVSRPEEDMFIIGAGKRDLPYDSGLPTVLQGGSELLPKIEVVALFDHHAVARGASAAGVGDEVTFGISHPCSLFDRYDTFLVDAGGRRRATWSTSFARAT